VVSGHFLHGWLTLDFDNAARRSAPGSVERERAQGLIGGRSVQQRPARRLHDTQARAATFDEEIHFVHSCERLIWLNQAVSSF